MYNYATADKCYIFIFHVKKMSNQIEHICTCHMVDSNIEFECENSSCNKLEFNTYIKTVLKNLLNSIFC